MVTVDFQNSQGEMNYPSTLWLLCALIHWLWFGGGGNSFSCLTCVVISHWNLNQTINSDSSVVLKSAAVCTTLPARTCLPGLNEGARFLFVWHTRLKNVKTEHRFGKGFQPFRELWCWLCELQDTWKNKMYIWSIYTDKSGVDKQFYRVKDGRLDELWLLQLPSKSGSNVLSGNLHCIHVLVLHQPCLLEKLFCNPFATLFTYHHSSPLF